VEVAAAEVDPEVTSSLAEDRAVSSNVASAVEGKIFENDSSLVLKFNNL
jgi:hypothetical protein